jgi:hypothetical protein
MVEFRRDLEISYGSISYLRRGAPVRGIEPKGPENRVVKKRLTEELDEWITNDPSGMSVEQARMVSVVENAEKSFAPSSMSPAEAERIANALDRALDDDE